MPRRRRGGVASQRDPLKIAHLANIVDSSDDAIISKDLDGTIRSWNRAAERMFGYREDEVLGRSIRLIIPPSLYEEEDSILARIAAGQSIDHFETRRIKKDGTDVLVSLSVSPLLNESGRIVGASKIARDVTEAARLREVANQKSEATRTLMEIGATVAGTLERDTVVQRVTDAATAATQAEFGAFFYNVIDSASGNAYMLYTLSGASKDAFDNFPQPRATAVFAPTFHGVGPVRMDDVTADPRYGQNPPYHGMPPGHLPVRSYLAVPVKGPADTVLGGLFFGHSKPGVFTSHHEELAVGIAAWAAMALENSRLYTTARDADRLKDEFLAVLSHELRTPLHASVGYSRLLRGGMLSGEEADRGLTVIERNAKALGQMVDDVLDVSRILSGKLRLDVQSVDLQLVLRDAIATVQPAADAKAVRIQTLVDYRIGPVSGDPARLQQVVWNLLTNAVKFTPKEGRVQVRLERVNSHVEIVVSDTGIGIRPEFLPHIFERCRQADAGISRNTGGLGLGLSIVRHIVEMHGGTVEAVSDGDGHGSTFRVKLPLMIVHGSRSAGVRHPTRDRLEALARLGDLRGVSVLAVDDEPDALALLQLILEVAGAQVTMLPSGALALEHLITARPHAIVADLGMPGMDGYEFIGRVRAHEDPAIREIPAAALTALARAEDRTKALESGFEMHLAKPVDPGELVAAVARLARRSRSKTQ
jgi:PAS domain S-box-containing protein